MRTMAQILDITGLLAGIE